MSRSTKSLITGVAGPALLAAPNPIPAQPSRPRTGANFTALLLTFATLEAFAMGSSEKPKDSRESAEPGRFQIAPIGVRIDQHLPIPEHAKGPALDTKKGYRLEDLGQGLYMITDNVYQSMFMVYDTGVVVLDAPPSYAPHIAQGIREVTRNPITHLIYSHSHIDHIGGAKQLGAVPTVIAHEETKRLLDRAKDANRPLPSVTFADRYSLKVGNQVLELSYHGVAHEPGNIFIYAPPQQTLMVIDVVFPGWMPWRRFALAQDVPGYFAQVEEIRAIPFKTLVAGHVARTGTHADVELQSQFMNDVKAAATKALTDTKPGEGLAPSALNNAWAVFDDYIDRVAAQCVKDLTPKWSSRLAAFDVYIWDQCYAMEQSLRID
jgi:glyoxylase-like metal-dependent hydrolase (beta-lactamase superfamily II)